MLRIFSGIFLFLWVFPSVSVAFEEEVHLWVGKGAQVPLESVGVSLPDEGRRRVKVVTLTIEEGGIAYSDGNLVLEAKQILIKPKGSIRTNGNNISILCDLFDAGLREETALKVETQPRDPQSAYHYMNLLGAVISARQNPYRRDTLEGSFSQLPNPDAEDAGNGGCGPDGEHSRTIHESRSPSEKRGGDGKDGDPAYSGKSAGDISVDAKEFRGGLFIAYGGNGGKGGDGGRGGDGGNGYSHDEAANPNDVSEGHVKGICDAGAGGSGGSGGKGGNGGNGGNVKLRVKKNRSLPNVSLFVCNWGGKSGRGGEGGGGGSAGTRTKIWFHGRHKPLGYEYHGKFNVGGSSGSDGVSGEGGIEGNTIREFEESGR